MLGIKSPYKVSDLVDDMPIFSPRRPWWGGDLQTIRNFTRQAKHALSGFASDRVSIAIGDGTGDHMMGALNLPIYDKDKPLVVLIHGISGSENSCYMGLAAAFFLARGYPVLRLNQRGAGPSRPLCKREYHAGSSDDLRAFFEKLDPRLTRYGVLPIGFSLGGNALLKFLGTCGWRMPIKRAATVSAPIDLAQSCLSLQRWRNFAYHRYILTRLKRHCTAPGAELAKSERQAILSAKSLWQFDDQFTAKRNGFRDANAYYRDNAAKNFLGDIEQPTLLIHAKDDPFVPVHPYFDQRWSSNPNLHILLPRSGGHLGFHDPAGLWHLRQIDRFFSAA